MLTHSIRVSRWAPFKTPEGNHGVLRLTFDHDTQIVMALRERLRLIHQYVHDDRIGGFLGDHQAWFWKEPYLKDLEEALTPLHVTLLLDESLLYER